MRRKIVSWQMGDIHVSYVGKYNARTGVSKSLTDKDIEDFIKESTYKPKPDFKIGFEPPPLYGKRIRQNHELTLARCYLLDES